MAVKILALAAAVASAASAQGSIADPADFVNILGGTKSRYDLSHGNILPEVQVPWGFNGWSPETDTDQGSWFFYSESRRIYGVRCTHQPSPWISDYGSFRVMSYVTDPSHADNQQYSGYNPKNSQWSPYYWNASLEAYGNRNGYATIEVTPTWHGAVFRFTYPAFDNSTTAQGFNQTRRVMISLDQGGNGLSIGGTGAGGTGVTTMAGKATGQSGGTPSAFGMYFYATIAGGADGNTVVAPLTTSVEGTWAYVDYLPTNTNSNTLILRIATSLISPAQAQSNYAQEVGGQSFDGIVAAAKNEWNSLLSRISVNDIGPGYTPQQEADALVTFYSSFYRASKYPRYLWEINATTQQPVHWSPYDGNVHDGQMVTDQGFWDAYRTTYSFLSLHAPEVIAQMMDGWINAYNEGGWVPQWSSPGYRGAMTGTMSDVSFSEAIVKLPHCGSDRALAAGYCINATALYFASRQNAFDANAPSFAGRDCLTNYETLGYISSDSGCDATVTRSLNYYHSDWAIAQAAKMLGYTTDYEVLLARSQNWTKLLEPTTGFLRARDSSGNWVQPFDEFAWGPAPGYTEAGPWQYRVEVPYDPQGLKAGLAAIGFDGCNIIQEANTIGSYFHMGGYGNEIHEQTEMATLCWGQWELNNQPVWALQHMQVGFDTSVTGKCASQAQYWLRKSTTLFNGGSDMYPGDEDNGSMGAWHILNVLGLYPLSPASGDYVLGSPLFANVTINLSAASGSGSGFNNVTLTISALNQGPMNVYVQGVTWNGAPVTGVNVAYNDLMQGGVLQFTMGPTPAADSGKAVAKATVLGSKLRGGADNLGQKL